MNELGQLLARRRARLSLPRRTALLAALRKADAAREQLRQAEAALEECFEANGDDDTSVADLDRLRTAWAEFRAEGGVTGDDFASWIEGKPVDRLEHKVGRKHLNLVAVHAALPPIRLRCSGPEAA
jgi:hypothetical protein